MSTVIWRNGEIGTRREPDRGSQSEDSRFEQMAGLTGRSSKHESFWRRIRELHVQRFDG